MRSKRRDWFHSSLKFWNQNICYQSWDSLNNIFRFLHIFACFGLTELNILDEIDAVALLSISVKFMRCDCVTSSRGLSARWIIRGALSSLLMFRVISCITSFLLYEWICINELALRSLWSLRLARIAWGKREPCLVLGKAFARLPLGWFVDDNSWLKHWN